MSIKKSLLVFAMVTILCMVILTSIAYATQTESTTVNAGEQRIMTFNLNEGDKFSGSLSITGGGGNDVDFWVTDPNGNTIVNSGRVSQGRTFDFTAQRNGAYSLHLDNGFSIFSSKYVSVSYDIQRESIPIAPNVTIPVDTVFYLILAVVAIVILAFIGLGISVIMRRNRNRPPNPPTS